jgi:hypothetical protein
MRTSLRSIVRASSAKSVVAVGVASMPNFHHGQIALRNVPTPNRSDVRFQVEWTQFSIPGVRRFHSLRSRAGQEAGLLDVGRHALIRGLATACPMYVRS